MDLKIGDIILVRGQGIISDIIKDISHSKYSHTAIYIGNDLIIEAEGFKKTGYVSINKYKGTADVFRCDNLSDRKRAKIAEYLKGQVGGQYDWLLLFLEFLRYVFHTTIRYKEKFNCHICSMLGGDAYKTIGVFLCPGIKYPSPGDISESKLLRKVDRV